jgi:DNA-nicking Smr family endonuclease
MTRSSNDDDEARAFAEAMRGARRLPGPAVTVADDAPVPAARAGAPRPPSAAGSLFEVEEAGESISGRARDVSAQLLRALRAGEPPIAARLDLHGRVLADVAREVERFIVASRSRGCRVLLLIHGRGLRPAVWEWLRSPAAARAGVMAFASARPRDGGAGATVVLLRRS